MNLLCSRAISLLIITILKSYVLPTIGSDVYLDRELIVGGEDVPINEYPWFAGSQTTDCSGSLVAPEFILTAAHCYYSLKSFKIGEVCRNDADVNNNNCGQRLISIDIGQKFMHPKYTNVITNVHDIALMKLTTRVPDDVPYVEMDMNSLSATYESGHKLWVIGFGKTSFMGDYSNTLKHVQVKFIPNDVCDNMYAKNNEKVVDSMICADDTDKDACQGDSGGPLYDKDKNILVGVVSWGHGCADSQYPGVYSRISDQWEWIKSTICDNHSNPKPNYCTEPTLNATKSPSDHLHQEEYQDEELESSDR